MITHILAGRRGVLKSIDLLGQVRLSLRNRSNTCCEALHCVGPDNRPGIIAGIPTSFVLIDRSEKYLIDIARISKNAERPILARTFSASGGEL